MATWCVAVASNNSNGETTNNADTRSLFIGKREKLPPTGLITLLAPIYDSSATAIPKI